MERCTASTCFLTLYQQTGKTPYLLQAPLLEAGLYLYNTRFTKVDGFPYPRHFLPLTHISPFWRGYVSNDNPFEHRRCKRVNQRFPRLVVAAAQAISDPQHACMEKEHWWWQEYRDHDSPAQELGDPALSMAAEELFHLIKEKQGSEA